MIHSVAFSRRLAAFVVTSDFTVFKVDIESGTTLFTATGALCVAALADSNVFTVNPEDWRNIVELDRNTGVRCNEIETGHCNTILNLRFSHCGRYFFTCGADNCLKRISLAGEILDSYECTGKVYSCFPSYCGTFVISAQYDRKAVKFNISDDGKVLEYGGHERCVTDVLTNLKNTQVITSSWDLMVFTRSAFKLLLSASKKDLI
eukprot:GEMP01083673.1.p1 GENE.GEMP01083673.1~~GEMP01083673.1.p1  ORF type:complete len:205 (+),score=32.58 GEMP01083673.1:300-914(+)